VPAVAHCFREDEVVRSAATLVAVGLKLLANSGAAII
jgi:hypothetical protein